jgi:hypothetical protein
MADTSGRRAGLFSAGVGAGLLLVATGAFFIWRSMVEIPVGKLHQPGPGAIPLFLAGALVVLGIGVMIAEAMGRASAEKGRWGDLGHAALLVGGCIFTALAMERLGYILTILCVLVFFLLIVERKPIIPALLVSVGMSFGSYWLLAKVMKQALPTGLLGF